MPFGVEGVKGQGGFARSADPADHRQAVEGDIDVQVFEVVLAGADYSDNRFVHGGKFFFLISIFWITGLFFWDISRSNFSLKLDLLT